MVRGRWNKQFVLVQHFCPGGAFRLHGTLISGLSLPFKLESTEVQLLAVLFLLRFPLVTAHTVFTTVRNITRFRKIPIVYLDDLSQGHKSSL